jgi:hypothetical protein
MTAYQQACSRNGTQSSGAALSANAMRRGAARRACLTDRIVPVQRKHICSLPRPAERQSLNKNLRYMTANPIRILLFCRLVVPLLSGCGRYKVLFTPDIKAIATCPTTKGGDGGHQSSIRLR